MSKFVIVLLVAAFAACIAGDDSSSRSSSGGAPGPMAQMGAFMDGLANVPTRVLGDMGKNPMIGEFQKAMNQFAPKSDANAKSQ